MMVLVSCGSQMYLNLEIVAEEEMFSVSFTEQDPVKQGSQLTAGELTAS